MDKEKLTSWFYTGVIIVSVGVILLFVLANIKIIRMDTYVNKDLGYRIKYPIDWQVVEKKNSPGYPVAFVSPKTGPLDDFLENVTLVVQGVPPKIESLNDLSNVIVKQVTGTFEGHVEVIDGRYIKWGGQRAYRFEWGGAGGEATDPMMYLNVWTMRGSKLYILTFVARRSTYDTYKKKYVNKMIKSFAFLEPDAAKP